MLDEQSVLTGNLPLKAEVDALLVELGVDSVRYTGGTLVAKTPITGETVAHVREVDTAGATLAIERAHAAFLELRHRQTGQREVQFSVLLDKG